MPRTKVKDKMPAIQELPSGSYRVQIYIGTDAVTGKKLYDSFTHHDRGDVMRWALDRIREREYNNERRSSHKITFGEAVDAYIESKSAILSPATIREYKRKRKKSIQVLMDKPIGTISQQDIQIAINIESASHSPKTVKDIHGLITAVMSVYRPDFRINTTLPQKEKTEIEIPTDDEISRLLDAAKGLPEQVPICLAACCGMRRSEICALKWSDVDFKKDTIRIKEALVYDENDELVAKKTKTTESTRTISMMPVVKSVLLAAHEGKSDSDNVTELTPNAVYHRYSNLLAKCGIRHYKFHSLRHYVVSVLLYLNVPKKYIASYVGHSSESMIDQVYGHIMADKKQSFTDKLNDYFSKMF
jgi:integrase